MTLCDSQQECHDNPSLHQLVDPGEMTQVIQGN